MVQSVARCMEQVGTLDLGRQARYGPQIFIRARKRVFLAISVPRSRFHCHSFLSKNISWQEWRKTESPNQIVLSSEPSWFAFALEPWDDHNMKCLDLQDNLWYLNYGLYYQSNARSIERTDSNSRQPGSTIRRSNHSNGLWFQTGRWVGQKYGYWHEQSA